MNSLNSQYIRIGSGFLDEYLRRIEEIERKHEASQLEARIAGALGRNAFYTWSVLFSDKQSPFVHLKLPVPTGDKFRPAIMAFTYFVSVELEEVFDTYNSPFTQQSLKDALAPLKGVSKEKISEIVTKAIGGDDAGRYLRSCEALISDARASAKRVQQELVKKYFWGIQIMIKDTSGELLGRIPVTPGDATEELAVSIFQQNSLRLISWVNDQQADAEQHCLSWEEQEQVRNYASATEQGELAQARDLIANCKSKYQFAKTHSVYVKDWEKTRKSMENSLREDRLPPGISANVYRAIINATDAVMKRKLELVTEGFQRKFGESIYNFLGPDGKTKKVFGLF